MTLIATDLDRTLIFSERFVGLHPTTTAVCEVEQYKGRNISLMAEEVRSSLKLLADAVTLVPTTTRTVSQLRRIDLGVTPSLEIACSGAVIIRDGQVDSAWRQHVATEVAKECLSHAEATRAFDSWIGKPWFKDLRNAEDAFLIAGVGDLPADELHAVTEELVVGNWRVVHQGSKVYAIPRVITKWAALDHLQQGEEIWAAGDSILDWDMLAHAKRAWTTADGELTAHGRTAEHLQVTAATGLDASVEIVRAWCALSL